MRAFSIIPCAVRTESQPVTASIKIPPGAVDVLVWPIVTERMLKNENFSALCEWWYLDKHKQPTDNGGSVRAAGDPALIPVGMVGGLPGQIPTSTVNFDLETENRISPAGGMGVPAGAEYVRITLIPEGGNDGGDIWLGCVLTAQNELGDFLDFDQTTRGS